VHSCRLELPLLTRTGSPTYRDRQRRIKCDEKRPACANCIRARKICSGYPPPPRSARPFEEVRLAPKPPAARYPAVVSISLPPRRVQKLQARSDAGKYFPTLAPSPCLPTWVPGVKVAVQLAPGMPESHRDRINSVVLSLGGGSATLGVFSLDTLATETGETWSPDSIRGERALPALGPILVETEAETETETDIKADIDDNVFSSDEVSLSSSVSTTSFEISSTEALLLIFIDDGNLQYLWPQLVQVAGTARYKQVILGLIRQYGDNLYREATTKLESNASLFVRDCAASIAGRICSAFSPKGRHSSGASQMPPNACEDVGEQGAGKGLLPTANLEYFSPDIRLVEAFLFESDAYLALQASVELFVRANSTLGATEDGLASSLKLGLQLARANLGYTRSSSPPEANSGTARLGLTCVSYVPY
jgi:hypothetical protein